MNFLSINAIRTLFTEDGFWEFASVAVRSVSLPLSLILAGPQTSGNQKMDWDIAYVIHILTRKEIAANSEQNSKRNLSHFSSAGGGNHRPLFGGSLLEGCKSDHCLCGYSYGVWNPEIQSGKSAKITSRSESSQQNNVMNKSIPRL